MFAKRLLLLVPFVGFAFEPRFAEMEQNGIDDLKAALDEVSNGLIRMVDSGEIDAAQHRYMIEWTNRVFDKLTMKYEKIKRGVDELMSGYILRTKTDEILDQGLAQGRDEERRSQIEIMLRDGRTPEEIADFCKYDTDLIKDVEKSMLTLV